MGARVFGKMVEKRPPVAPIPRTPTRELRLRGRVGAAQRSAEDPKKSLKNQRRPMAGHCGQFW